MALTPSGMVPLGTPAPDFRLQDTRGQMVALSDFKSKKILLVMFICNHCPYVIHVNSALVALANDYSSKSVGIVAINANDVVNYPEDSMENMKWVGETGRIF